MFRLLTFLSDYRNTILFLVLEAIAFALVINYNDYQRHKMGDWVLESTSGISGWKVEVRKYFKLAEENEKLLSENIRLRQDLLEVKKQAYIYEGILELDSVQVQRYMDSLSSPESFEFLPARVIRNSTDKNYNYITIDRGSKHGVINEMGVVSPEGIVGRVIRVSESYSLVQSALSINFNLTCKALLPGEIAETGNIGFYEWSGGNIYKGYLTYIPETVELLPGYKVVTSGHSLIFPEGFLVGEITELENSSAGGFQTAEVKLATNFNNLRHVYLIHLDQRENLDSLLINLPDE
ncbi:rod shape-determining protein MreC [Pontibacter sp. G13]|uniref:rod shape-determining protein MreC n=1 Tax=Pontibacter sp. G13 TaxID=3074898 RepID=UPI00288A3909|nr:rod shape-determining protein MreC [Pontibacter sp. G13]WNJ16710.1 rod shape-determining protein MreC [Pontibacter sp. G13]